MGIYRVRTAWTGGPGGNELTTFWFSQSSPFTAQDAVNAAATFWSGGLASSISNAYTWTVEGEVAVVDPGTGQITTIESATGDSGNGGSSSEQLPPMTQALVRWRTGIWLGGRQLLGRTFIPGLTEPANDNGNLAGDVRDDIINAAVTMLDDSAASFGVYSPKNLTWRAATSSAVNTGFAFLNSRRG